jgi:predicted negative regulator of RcsB-dependent stress response
MRLVAVLLALAAVVGFTAWHNARSGNEYVHASPAPTAVNCGDAAELGQKALDGRRQRDEANSDQEKIVASNRATLYASLAIIADLKCKHSLPEAGRAARKVIHTPLGN